MRADPLTDISNTKKIERVMKNGRWVELTYHPEYVTLVKPAVPLAASTFAPVISSIRPSSVTEGSPSVRVVLEGSGFMMTSLVRVDGISVKTTFRDPRHLEFDLPAVTVARATPNPYRTPGPAKNVGIIGERAVAVHVFNPPPEGGTSNTVHQLVLPREASRAAFRSMAHRKRWDPTTSMPLRDELRARAAASASRYSTAL